MRLLKKKTKSSQSLNSSRKGRRSHCLQLILVGIAPIAETIAEASAPTATEALLVGSKKEDKGNGKG